MTRAITITDNEKLEHLAEEIRSILSESVFSARMTLLEGKHLVGKTIVKNPLYKKSGKGSGKIVKELAKRLGRSDKDLYLCVRFYQKFPDVSMCVQTLKGKKNDITWANTRRLLGETKEIENHICEWEKVERCKICRKLRENGRKTN